MKTDEWIVMIACCAALVGIGKLSHEAMDFVMGMLAGVGMRDIFIWIRGRQ
jgi:hypothetical protein